VSPFNSERKVFVQQRLVVSLALVSLVSAAVAGAQPAAPAAGGRTDLYHVQFLKALPGKAAEVANGLKTPDPKAPMPGHFVILRHQAGDDWDYCVIEHLGKSATVEAAAPPPTPVRSSIAWHTDTFAAGPAWDDFAKAMGLTGEGSATSVYSVAVWRAIPGQAGELEKALSGAGQGSKVPVSHVLLQHREGSPWNFLAIDRYNSWQDYGADQATSVPQTGTGQDGWSQVRQYSTYHHDTLADRIPTK
jgi:hypothetical protein